MQSSTPSRWLNKEKSWLRLYGISYPSVFLLIRKMSAILLPGGGGPTLPLSDCLSLTTPKLPHSYYTASAYYLDCGRYEASENISLNRSQHTYRLTATVLLHRIQHLHSSSPYKADDPWLTHRILLRSLSVPQLHVFVSLPLSLALDRHQRLTSRHFFFQQDWNFKSRLT